MSMFRNKPTGDNMKTLTKMNTNPTSSCEVCGCNVVWVKSERGVSANHGTAECSNCFNKGEIISRVWNELGIRWEHSTDSATGQVVLAATGKPNTDGIVLN